MRTTRFTVAMPRPETHLYDITMEVDPAGATTIDLVLPVWTPGSYLVREFARHVRDFSAKEISSSGRGARPLTVEKVSKNTWRVSPSSPFKEEPLSLPLPLLSIRYRVYSHELTVTTSHLASPHAYATGATL